MKYIHTFCFMALMSLNLHASVSEFADKNPGTTITLAAVGAVAGVVGGWKLFKKTRWWLIQRKSSHELYQSASKVYDNARGRFIWPPDYCAFLRECSEAEYIINSTEVLQQVAKGYSGNSDRFLTGVVGLFGSLTDELQWQIKILEAKVLDLEHEDLKFNGNCKILIGDMKAIISDMGLIGSIITESQQYRSEQLDQRIREIQFKIAMARARPVYYRY